MQNPTEKGAYIAQDGPYERFMIFGEYPVDLAGTRMAASTLDWTPLDAIIEHHAVVGTVLVFLSSDLEGEPGIRFQFTTPAGDMSATINFASNIDVGKQFEEYRLLGRDKMEQVIDGIVSGSLESGLTEVFS